MNHQQKMNAMSEMEYEKVIKKRGTDRARITKTRI